MSTEQEDDIPQELVALGTLLSQQRKSLGLSIKEVESATSIRTSYIEAIEQGRIDRLLSPIYAQGFVRQYALFLGLDGEKLVAEHIEFFRRPTNQEFSYGIGTLETRGSPGGSVKSLPGVYWIAAFGAILVVAYFFAKMVDVL